MNQTRLTDGELAAQVAEGDREQAIREFVRRHGAMVLGTCRRVTGSLHDGEDAAQLVFATLVTRASELTRARSLAGWLYNTAWHVSRRTRRTRVNTARHERHAQCPEPIELNGHADEETLQELYHAIEMLPPEYGEAVVLHHLQGLTVKQVSELMSCTPGTTAARLSRGRAMMRERLAWRGLVLSTGAVEAFLLKELLHQTDVSEWVANVAMNSESATANAIAQTPNQGAVAGRGGLSGASGNAAVVTVALTSARRWLFGIACAAFIMTAAPASPVLFHSAGAFYRLHISAGGEASAETKSAGMVAYENPAAEAAAPGSTSTVPEPGSMSLLALAGLMLRRRRPS